MRIVRPLHSNWLGCRFMSGAVERRRRTVPPVSVDRLSWIFGVRYRSVAWAGASEAVGLLLVAQSGAIRRRVMMSLRSLVTVEPVPSPLRTSAFRPAAFVDALPSYPKRPTVPPASARAAGRDS